MSLRTVAKGPRKRSRGTRSGRASALATLDQLMAGKANQKAMMAALEAKFRKDPVRFFRKFVMPLLPRNANLSAAHDGVVTWQSLLDDRPAGRQRGEVAS